MTERTAPRAIGRYRIDGVLGEGAMAIVYAGFDPGIDRPVAIKCLHRSMATDPGSQDRFLLEARASGHLVHPNIVTVFDTGETDDGRKYIAMERLSGETLASRVARDGLPPLSVTIELATQIASALDYAHGQGVIHHDVKPENIMLAEDWHYAKLSDFGTAERRALRDPRHGGDLQIGGTPAYMALERLRGEPADARSDLFSLGVVLYWLVTGKMPWIETQDLNRLIRDRQRRPRPTIAPIDPATPAMLVGIVRTLLSPTADARYQNGAEVIDDLRLARREYERSHEAPLAARIISLRLRWIGGLAAILCLVLLLGLTTIYAKQGDAVTGLAQDFGSSLGRMVASESAENLLLGDDAATRALVLDIARNKQIHYLAIANRQGAVIASTRAAEVGHPFASAQAKPPAVSSAVDSYLGSVAEGPQGSEMLLFDLPIRYQDKLVGELRLGVGNEPLLVAQRTTLWVIVAVLLVTLTAVVGAAYWLFRRPLALLGMLGDALMRVARGDYHYRIRLVRRDELGRLFAAFNLMNSALQTREPKDGAPTTGHAADDASQVTRVIAPPEASNDPR
ncbi:protein kinase domain-containing protein [Dyella soli]|uniref:HAMP domain-containing protein n=1 Tax=Dyella soli TaxID=522319 RepID=A0A4V2NM21_9GAMM|nr:protein kinase [Dyella soli]TCI11291.1 HAMP domain-containing protein [Dyella soli]